MQVESSNGRNFKVALTYTPAGELGSPCPQFTLPSVEGKTIRLSDFDHSKLLVVMFICNHCPYVKAIEDRLLRLGQGYQPHDVSFVAICSNDATDYPEDEPRALLKRAQEKNYPFPYLVDSDQTVARGFGAVCTPDLFVFDRHRKLAYRGRLDDSWKNPDFVRRTELKEAIELLLAGKEVNTVQNPSMGCSIKWKK